MLCSLSTAHRISVPGTAFSRYNEIVDQRHRPDGCGQQPHAVDPDRDAELEHGERQIDGVPAEVIRALANDHGGGLSGRYGRAGCPEFRDRVRKQRDGNRDERQIAAQARTGAAIHKTAHV